MTIFYDTSANFHPYECDGPGKCPHCDRTENEWHNPGKCALCDDSWEADARTVSLPDVGGNPIGSAKHQAAIESGEIL